MTETASQRRPPLNRSIVPPTDGPTVQPSHCPTVPPSDRLTILPSSRPTVSPSHRLTVLIGASGFGLELLWVCRRAGLDVAGFCDDAADKQSGSFCDLPLFGRIEEAALHLPVGTTFHCAVGSNRARQTLAERALAVGWVPVTVVDPSALIAPDTAIEAGAYVGIGSVVSCLAQVGRFAIVNHHVTVGHEAVIGAFAQLCPGVRVSGACTVGEGALLGSNAVVIPGRRVGAWATLGAGAVALRDVPDNQSVIRLQRS